MFTGLVAEVGTIQQITPLESGVRLRLGCQMADGSLELGESIAVDGCCLTVIAQGQGWFDTDVSHESLARTNLRAKEAGAPVNLERAMRLGDRLGGHWVQGHVDGVGALAGVKQVGESHEIEVSFPADLGKYIVEKGSITVSGVSLTVNAVVENRVRINLIPHTWAHTSLGRLAPGAAVNLEVDVLAKYVERLLAGYRS
jgi:riboflavin synthase